jgi:SAM-dependent methyltransferase
VSAPERPWFNEIARFLGPAYLRNAFTKGTEQEIEFLVETLDLEAGMRVLDVGCGPGRHALALARRGFDVLGVDLSPEFVSLARDAVGAEGVSARFDILDVRDLGFDAQFDAAICLCQGGFGLLGGQDDAGVVGRIVRAVVPGGAVAVTAFSAYFALRFLEDGEEFDLETGVLHEIATVRNNEGDERPFDAWTTCFTARELRLLAAESSLDVEGVYGVAPGRYRAHPPTLEDPELLLLGRLLR